MPPEGKGKFKDGKGKTKPAAAEILKNLLMHPKTTQDMKDALSHVNFDREFDEVKVTKSVLKCVELSLAPELERCIIKLDADPFNKLMSNGEIQTNGDSVENDSELNLCPLEFYLLVLKSIAFMDLKFEGLADLLQLKFKQSLIKVVLADKLPEELRNESSLICERIMEQNKFVEDDTEGSSRWLTVYLWVVKCCLREGASRCEIKRVWSMHKLLTRYSVPVNSPVFEVLATTTTSTNFLAHKEGRQHIAYLLSLDKALVAPLHAKIKTSLPSIFEKSKLLACSYGEIYNMAWTNALLEVRQELEVEVFQRWMEVYLRLDRPKGLVTSQFGKVIFRILSYLHNSRRLLELSSAITRLYQPILWRSLMSHHPLERCNATELFLDVFPLEKPDCNIVENSNFKQKQFKQIIELLKDESHHTRIVAIRGLVLVLERRMDCLSNAQCKEILSCLANDLTNDGSTYLVRVAVWEFFASLAASSDPPEFLISLLPQMTNYFHDVSEQVRKAFATMLLQISRNKSLSISYTDVVPMSHIIARLALEGEQVGKVLVQLLMKSIYTDGMEVLQLVKHLKRLILMCPKAAENLFRWSSQVLTPPNAQFIIMGILIYLRSFTKERIEGRPDGSGKSTASLPANNPEENVDDKENKSSSANSLSDTTSPSASPVKKKSKKSKRRKEHSSLSISTKQAGEEEVIIDIDGPTAEMHAHLLGCAHVLWVVFSSQFESRPQIISELNNVITVCLQNYLRCYKGTPAWYASLALASLVPVTKLSENTTASSSCLGELRRTELSTPVTQTEALVYTLTAWNRGNEIMELAMDYIDPVFKLFHLNSSVFLTAGGRGRSVRFVKDSGKEMIGLRMLTILLRDYHNEQRLLLKHYDQLHELYSYLEGIKVILEAVVADGLSQESLSSLTDQFILECFELLLQLIPILDRAEVSFGSSVPVAFSSSHQMVTILDWASRVLLPRVKAMEILPEEQSAEEEQEEELEEEQSKGKSKKKKKKVKKLEEVKEDLIVTCLKSLMKATTFMVKIGITDKVHCAASAKLALSLIQSEGCYWFVESGLELVEGLSEHTRAWHPEDQDQVLSIMCPSLYSHILLSVTSNPQLSFHLLRRYNCDIVTLKRKLPGFLVILLAMYGSSHACFNKVLKGAMEVCIAAIHSEAIKVEAVDIASKVDDLPQGASLVTISLLSRPKLLSLILPTMVDIVKQNIEDGVMVVCSLSYLYTVIENYRKNLLQIQMEQTVHTLYPLVSKLKPLAPHQSNQESESEGEDSFFVDPLAKLDVRKLGGEILRNIADVVPCSLFRPSSPVPSIHVRSSILSPAPDIP